MSTLRKEIRRAKGAPARLLSHPSTALAALGVPPSAEKAVRYFATHPTARPYARELQRKLGLGGASAQRDLERLTEIGALKRASDGRLVRYVPELNSRFWRGIRFLVADPNEPAALLRDALCDVEGLTAAFVFGSIAKGSAQEDSDVDVFVVEAAATDRRALHRQLAEAAVLLGREVNPTCYTLEKLAERLANRALPGYRFVREVLAGPKQWVAGSPEELTPVGIAAGIPRDRIAAE
ncbi:MAG TPA: nucleotidyltransferase domain-containing protein [Gemmatimonadaceae bacterium]|nr:nucleotidyltransferase domain-containing protein [Gemmatimonadaceae bacterium]